jgi:hypothetical protein
MRTKLAVGSAIAATALVWAAVASPASAKNTQLAGTMSGAQEVPGPGDPDGAGTAEIDVKTKPGKKNAKVCFALNWTSIDQAVAAHIHQGAAGADGPIVVPLFESAAGLTGATGCVKTKSKTAKQIAKSPAGFYVNVHTAAFPAGAIRGQLAAQ